MSSSNKSCVTFYYHVDNKMIPIIVGPQGPGFENIYVDPENNIVEVTTPPITYINIGNIGVNEGPTGSHGTTGYQSSYTGSAAIECITGPQGLSISAVLYNELDCKLQFIYNNGTNFTSQQLDCKKPLQAVTGATGSTGPSVEYILLYCGTGPNKIQTIYSDSSYIYANICCVCPVMTGYTGIQGLITDYGATGPTGRDGYITQYGATGPTGENGQNSYIDIVLPSTPVGPQGSYNYNSEASIYLDGPIQFTTNSLDCIKRTYIFPYQRAEILFTHTPLNVHWNISSSHANFSVVSAGLKVNTDMIIRIRMTWTSSNFYYKPFATIKNDELFPTLITTTYPNITTFDDMVCKVTTGDIIEIYPGTYTRYPVSSNLTFNMNFSNINFNVVTIYN